MVSTTPVSIHRATIEDIPKIARFWVRCRGTCPIRTSRYPLETVSDEEYEAFKVSQTTRQIMDKTQRVFLAINGDGDILGFLIYARRKMGDVNTVVPPEAQQPKGENVAVTRQLEAYQSKTMEKLKEDIGPHLYVKQIEVHPKARRQHIASALLKEFQIQEFSTSKQLVECLFTTYPATKPFYDAIFAETDYKLVSFADPITLPTSPPLTRLYYRVVPKDHLVKDEKLRESAAVEEVASGYLKAEM